MRHRFLLISLLGLGCRNQALPPADVPSNIHNERLADISGLEGLPEI